MEEEDNLTRQVDEIEAMSAIYGDEWCVVDESNRMFCISVADEQKQFNICIQVLLPNEYPSEASPIYQLNAPWLRDDSRTDLQSSLDNVCKENVGECVLHLMVEKIREFVEEKVTREKMSEPNVTERMTKESDLAILSSLAEVPDTIELPPLIHGDAFTDRRSTFQAHLAFPVVEVQQVKLLMQRLCENRKIANATHNIMAYRIHREDKDAFLQDFDEDGETAAGGRLLHLLQIVNAKNVMVVVSRWYGGILLGPDRFKHINNAARNLMESSGLLQTKDVQHKPKKTK